MLNALAGSQVIGQAPNALVLLANNPRSHRVLISNPCMAQNSSAIIAFVNSCKYYSLLSEAASKADWMEACPQAAELIYSIALFPKNRFEDEWKVESNHFGLHGFEISRGLICMLTKNPAIGKMPDLMLRMVTEQSHNTSNLHIEDAFISCFANNPAIGGSPQAIELFATTILQRYRVLQEKARSMCTIWQAEKDLESLAKNPAIAASPQTVRLFLTLEKELPCVYDAVAKNHTAMQALNSGPTDRVALENALRVLGLPDFSADR